MELIYNNNSESYQTQSDAFINFYELKCHLLGNRENSKLFINKALLSTLPKIESETYYWGQFQEFVSTGDFDNINLSVKFNDNGIIVTVGLNINTSNGNIDFFFIDWCIEVGKFRIPKDFNDLKSIKAIMNEKGKFYNPKGKFYKKDYIFRYIENKYINHIEKWLDILASLPKKNICNDCSAKYELNLRRNCPNHLYKNNMSPK